MSPKKRPEYKVYDLQLPISCEHFAVKNLVVESQALKGNPLGDSARKHNLVLVPFGDGPWPLVVHLSGYFGNGPQNFNVKTLEENFPEQIISGTAEKTILPAVHVFVDAMTAVGGSQFINSEGCGDYSDYIQDELLPAVEKEFPLKEGLQHRWVAGASSGGYGALHHISLPNTPFGVAIVISPDSDFKTSLLPEMYKVAPYMSEMGDIKKIKKNIADPLFRKKKNFFDIMNVTAMSLCYGPLKKDRVGFPVDPVTGKKNEDWKRFLKKDPVEFIKDRAKNLKGKFIYLEVGQYDEFLLVLRGAKNSR